MARIESSATTLPLVPWRRRLASTAGVSYVGSLAIWTDAGRTTGAWVGALLALVLVLMTARRTRALERGAGWGLAVVIASLGARAHNRGLDACGALGVLTCAAAACVAIARVPSEGGMVKPARSSPVVGLVVVAASWWAAIVADVAPRDRFAIWMTGRAPVWSWTAIAATGIVLGVSTERTLRRRRHELGLPERMNAMRALLGTLLVAAGVAAAVGPAGADGVARLMLAIAGASATVAALHADVVRVARVTRRIVVLAMAGGGFALLGASVAAEGPEGGAWPATLVTALVALAIGSAAAALEAPLRPGGGVWLDAFSRACEEAIRPDPEDAIREALLALRAPTGLGLPPPELWLLTPTRVLTVDAAGYVHERAGELPDALVLVAGSEPEATLRAEVLDMLEVRRPELRPLATWMNDRRALVATVIACGGETEGILVMPQGARGAAASLEEVRALKRVADRLAAACRARATQSRMLARGRDAAARAAAAEDRALRLEHERALDAGRDAMAAARLARPASVGVYSAMSRMALEALERCTAAGAPIAIVAPSGVDPVPYLARAHLTGARGHAPLVVVDATSAREHDLARWADPIASPLALADRGMLVLLDGAALPADVQQLVARACGERRAPWERPEALDIELAITAATDLDDLVATERLDPTLALRLGDARSSPVVLPRLRDRAEDLRALLTDRLAREGLRVLGRPVGIERAAYARLVEYPFPGEEAELASIVRRLVSHCRGDVVRAADVDALRLVASPEPEMRKDPLSA
jgi:hypothetical protein